MCWMGLFSYANLRIDTRWNYGHGIIKKIINYPVYTNELDFVYIWNKEGGSDREVPVNHIGYLRTFILKTHIVTSVIAIWMGLFM